jgi:hypothetical protein
MSTHDICPVCEKPLFKTHSKCSLIAEVTYFNGPTVRLQRDMNSKNFICHCHLHKMGHQYKDRYNMQVHIDKHKARYYTNPTLVITVTVPKLY